MSTITLYSISQTWILIESSNFDASFTIFDFFVLQKNDSQSEMNKIMNDVWKLNFCAIKIDTPQSEKTAEFR